MRQGKFIPILFGGALGLFATLVQIVLVREFLVIRGTDELSLGVVLFNWLLFIAIGAFGASKIQPTGTNVCIVSALGALLMPAAFLLVRCFEAFFSVESGALLSMSQFSLLTFIAIAPFGFIIGFHFSTAASIVGKHSLSRVNDLYMSEALGAVAGGLLFTFVLVKNCGAIDILLLALSLLGMGAWLLNRCHRAQWWWLPVFLLVCFFGARWTNIDQQTVGVAFQFQESRGVLKQCRDTQYSRLCIGRNVDQFQLYRDGRLDYIFPDPFDRPMPIHFSLSQHADPKSVLVINSGVPNRLTAAFIHGVKQIDYVYGDNQEHRFLLPYFSTATRSALRDPRIRIIDESPRSYVESAKSTYDVVILFGSPPLSAEQNSRYTVQFFQTVRQSLKKDGVFVLATTGSANVMSRPAAMLHANQLATLRASFSRVQLFWGAKLFFVASEGSMITRDPKVIHDRLVRRNPSLAHIFSYGDVLRPIRTEQAEAVLRKIDGEVNIDGRPSTFLHSMDLVRLANNKRLSSEAEFPRNWSDIIFYASIFIPLFLIIGVSVRRKKAFTNVLPDLASITTTGLCGMGIELILLYMFSAKIGGLYHHIAWLLAGFMFGLALGALAGNRIRPTPYSRIISDVSVVAMLGLTAGLLSMPFASIWIFVVLILLGGFVTGFAFPVFMESLVHGNATDVPGKKIVDVKVGIIVAPAQFEAADHLGAAFGAVATSLIWLPKLGVTWTCVLLLVFKVPLIVKNIFKLFD